MRTFLLLTTVLVSVSLSACAPTVTTTGTARPASPQAAPVVQQPVADGTTKVALLLPLSGAQANLGQGLLNAAQLAVYDVGDEKFSLLPQDTQGTPEGAATATQRALADGAQLIIGPVFSPEVEAVKAISSARNIPVLALSNNENLSDPKVYVMGLSPLDQVGRALQQAKRNNLTRIAALLPQGAYADAVATAVQEEVELQGLTLVKLTRYTQADNLTAVAQGFMNELAAAGGAQALVFGETGASLLNLATQLAGNGYNPAVTRPLGTALWEDGVATRSPALAGGWYAAPAGTQRRAFTTRYTQTFGSAPPAIAPLAYDSTALAAVLARSPALFADNRMIDPMGFNGVDGIFRLHPSGNVERGLAVFEVSASGNTLLDAAPVSFGTPRTN